jgi:hypothetical protein
MYEEGKGVKQDDLRATTAKIQITRLLVKLKCFEIILFNALAFFIPRQSSFTKRRVI